MYKRPSRPDELYHWGMKKGEKAEDHKYVMRVEDGVTKAGTPKYLYFYTMDEYKAYKEGNSPKSVGNAGTKKPGLLSRISDAVTGKSYKERISRLDQEKNSTKGLAEGYRKSQHDREQSNGLNDAEANKDRQRANEFEEKYNKAVNEKAKLQREYEEKTIAGHIDKAKRMISKAMVKYAKEQIAKLDIYNQRNSINAKIVPSKYKVDKDSMDPDAQKYDNAFSDSDVLENVRKELIRPTGYNEESLKSDIRYEANKAPNESLAHYCQRQGLVDETADGFHPESFSDLKKLDEDVNDEIDMYCVNYDNLWSNKSDGDVDVTGEGYPDKYPSYGYTQNCAYCTLAYDMRQRGYNVEASSVSQDTANTEEVIESWYKGGEFTHASSTNPKDIEKEILENNPEGSRGQFCCFWSGGGGHSLVYEVKGGEVWIRDCQVGRKMKLKNYNMSQYFTKDRRYRPMFMRTDNLELTDRSLVGVKNR